MGRACDENIYGEEGKRFILRKLLLHHSRTVLLSIQIVWCGVCSNIFLNRWGHLDGVSSSYELFLHYSGNFFWLCISLFCGEEDFDDHQWQRVTLQTAKYRAHKNLRMTRKVQRVVAITHCENGCHEATAQNVLVGEIPRIFQTTKDSHPIWGSANLIKLTFLS